MIVSELEVVVKGNNKQLKSSLADSKKDVKSAGDAMGESLAKAGADGGKQFGKKLSAEMANTLRNTGAALSLALTAPIAKAGTDIVKSFGSFDEGLRNVDSLAKLSTKGFDDLKNSVLGLAGDERIKQMPADLANGLYSIYSSGKSGAEALDILKQSAYGASAGMTSTDTASRAVMAVLNSGIEGVTSASEAMNVLFKEVDLGVNTFEELAGQIGDVLPTAKAAGVSLQEIAAGMALLTRNGINAAESSTALNQLLTHIIHPSKEAAKAMQSAGIEFGVTALESKGLAGWLNDATSKLGGNKQALIELMPEVLAMKGLLVLADNDGREYNKMLAAMATASDGTGATTAALNRQMKGFNFTWAEVKKQIDLARIALGEALAPTLTRVAQMVRSTAQWFQGLSDTGKAVTLTVAGFTASLGPLLLGVSGVMSAITTVTRVGAMLAPVLASAGGAAGVLSGALTVLTGPIGWVIAAVAALGVAWKTNFLGIRDFTKSVVDQVVSWWTSNLPLIRSAAANLFNSLRPLLQAFSVVFIKGWQNMVAVVSVVWDVIKTTVQSALTSVLGTLKAFAQILTGDWRGAWQTIQATTQSVMFSVGAIVARGAAGLLRGLDILFDGISSGYHSIKKMLGLAGEGDPVGNFNGFDGMISGLDNMSTSADKASAALRGTIGLGGSAKAVLPDVRQPKGSVGVLDPVALVNSGSAFIGGRGAGSLGGSSKAGSGMDATKEQADELRKTLAELTKEIDLNGDNSKIASLAYDILNGRIKAGNENLAQEVYWYTVKAKLAEDERERLKKLDDQRQDLIKSITEQNKQNAISAATTELDRVALEKFGITFDQLGERKARQLVTDLAASRERGKEADRLRTVADYAKSTIAGLTEELGLRTALTRVEKLQFELQKEKYRGMDSEQRKALIQAAKALDDADLTDKATKGLESYKTMWGSVWSAIKRANDEKTKSADDRFSDSMLRLAERAAAIGTETQKSRLQFDTLAESFARGSTATDRMADGMKRAREYMAKLFEVEQLERFVAGIEKVADGFSKTITESLGTLLKSGVRPFLSNMLEGFRSTIASMAQEWLNSQIRRMLTNLGTSLLGSIIGGSATAVTPGLNHVADGDIPGYANGGSVPSASLFRMNEGGRGELFIAPDGGIVVPHDLSKRLVSGSGGSMTVNINVSTPDADSFRRSQDQIAAEAAAAIQRARRNA